MTTEMNPLDKTASQLNRSFLTLYPIKSAHHLESVSPEEAATLLESQPLEVSLGLWEFLAPGTSDAIFDCFSETYAIDIIRQLDSHLAIAVLNRLTETQRERLLNKLKLDYPARASEFKELLVYPLNTAASLMTSKIQAFHENTLAQEALKQLKKHVDKPQDVLFVLDEHETLTGEITLAELLKSPAERPLSALARPVRVTLSAMESKDEVVEKFEGYRCNAIPVLDAHQQLIGLVRFFDIYQSTKEDLVSDIQTMVGASKDEQALSSSWFAVKKRLPWLQINLLTAFAAAAVVGAFEGLISQVTALAILLPVAAGQSGNAGAQALAVTMRGLTLREITTRHWPKVLIKEMSTGLMNGVAIAITCSLAVYVWSQSIGLSVVIAAAMISSLVIACGSGAIVPIALKKFGLDPAQSSSIVLTTITDIAGFMSFLGIALLLSDFLPKG